jgi:protein-S-isoprenylcysteine O-methyltransferase Ste14
VVDATPDNAGVIAPPPLIFAGFLLIGLFLQWAWPLGLGPRIATEWLGGVALPVSLLIAGSALVAMKRERATVDPRKPTTTIVSAGPFRFTRNPLYLSLLVLEVGIGLWIDSLWVVLAVAPLAIVVQEGVIKREERYLEGKFGEEYLRYKSRVRRWI